MVVNTNIVFYFTGKDNPDVFSCRLSVQLSSHGRAGLPYFLDSYRAAVKAFAKYDPQHPHGCGLPGSFPYSIVVNFNLNPESDFENLKTGLFY